MRFSFMALLRSFALLLAVMFVAAPAFAQYTRDKAANSKIDEAINQHYLATDFDKAEGVLLGTIKACGKKCKPSTIARAWMYVGIVRGSGKADMDGAREAFTQAAAIDPKVKFDEALATPETKDLFVEVVGEPEGMDTAMAEAAGVEEGEEAEEGEEEEEEEEEEVGMECTPEVLSVQTLRAIPLSCQTDEEAHSMSLRYQVYGSKDWKTVKMHKAGEAFEGEVPCKATEMAGPLKYYVVATDKDGDTVDTFGEKGEPIVVNIAPEVNEDPPALPGRPPPARCAAEEICPPDFPGCGEKTNKAERGDKDWGASCDNSTECKAGLLCIDGSCETAPSCDSDEDCPSGVCMDGKCDIPLGEGGGKPYAKNWFGLHFGVDLAFVGGANVCRLSNKDFECYDQGTATPYPPELAPPIMVPPGEPTAGDAYPGTGIATGSAIGTMRVMASYDRAFGRTITLGVRAGFAFGGGPAAPGGAAFLPAHAEGRVAWWPLGMSEAGIRPVLHVGGGLAQVDVKVGVEVKDCSTQPDYSSFLDCFNAEGAYDADLDPNLPTKLLDAWRKFGTGFAGGGIGAVFAFNPNMGLQLDVSGMYMLPASGFVIEPSLGFVYGL